MGASETPGSGNDGVTHLMKLGSALFYGLASFLITVINKTVLTSYRFPSFLVLSLGQLAASVIVLWFGKQSGIVTFPDFTRDIPRRIFPLPLIYLGNMMFGLGGTQALSLPMFAALRRFSILMTMILELRILGVRPTTAVQVSVYAMVGGALLAASDDLSFNLQGYMFVMITNTLTAANGVYMKKKLDTADMGKFGLMYYNSLFMFFPALIGTWLCGDLDKAWQFEAWDDLFFAVQFLLSCVMGFILSYSTILCTQYNSALTTTIVGCLKNISVTYIGMFIGGDYVFSWLNSIGINISVAGSLLYAYVTFRKKSTSSSSSSGSSSQSADRKVLLPQAGRIDNSKQNYEYDSAEISAVAVYENVLQFINNILKMLRSVRLPKYCISFGRGLITISRNSEKPTNESASAQASSEDGFTKDFLHNHIKLTDMQKVLLGVGSALAALIDPRRHDMIACLGETTGVSALQDICRQMLNSEEGRQILMEKPRVNTQTINLEALKKLPEDSFGFHYVKFLEKHEITPDSRMAVRFVEDPDLAYVMTRYREVHDLVHTVLDMPTNMLGEVTVKWVEALNTGLPMCYGGAIFGASRLRPIQRQNYTKHYLPWALRIGPKIPSLMCVYWEKRWEQNIEDLRKELNIQTINI
ncbi:uncharacterized protein LOC129766507 [Toxorhynchites rutilus septentrionalis]|uniref:uncharacterized protein LOC129766507 n=1 Tax=Toxorhynchites rutilus septentrionalis TaxID=329112 RepID=UPI00247905A9|nr:uncharacterized protein LOC129766507 [Toxorhynchites rutilus septentrionalis]